MIRTLVFVIFASLFFGQPAYGGGWNPCDIKNPTEEQKRRCRLFNENSDHYKRLDKAVEGVGKTIREPLIIPEGVRRKEKSSKEYVK